MSNFAYADLLHLLEAMLSPQETRAAAVRNLQRLGLLDVRIDSTTKGVVVLVTPTEAGLRVAAEALAAAKDQV